MKKVFIVFLFALIITSQNNSVLAENEIYVNERGVSFEKEELEHLEKFGISDLELRVLTEDEKTKYLSFEGDKIKKESYYLKSIRIKNADGNYSYEEEIISEEEAISYVTRTVPELIEGGGSGPLWGPTYESSDNTDLSVRKLTISCSYNYTTDKMFVKATLEWYDLPDDRGWDLIGIGYTGNEWYIETVNTFNPDLNVYVQTAKFKGKQIYEWTEFDFAYHPDYILNVSTIQIDYDEENFEYYTPNYINGIVLKQNLKDNEIEWQNPAHGGLVSDLVLTLEADIDNIGNNDNGIFYASYLHQESYTTINIGDASFTPTPPFISVPLGFVDWGKKYESFGLNVSINVPIN